MWIFMFLYFSCFHMFSYVFRFKQRSWIAQNWSKCRWTRAMLVFKVSIFLWDPFDVLQELIGDVKASGRQSYAFQEYRNEQGDHVFLRKRHVEIGGPNTSVLSHFFYGCYLLWRRLHTTFSMYSCEEQYILSYTVSVVHLFTSFQILSQMAGMYCNHISITVQRSWNWCRKIQLKWKYWLTRSYVHSKWTTLHNHAQASKWWSLWDSGDFSLCFWEGSTRIWQQNAQMHRMGDMISSTDSDMSSPGSFRASQDCIRLRLIAEVPTQDRGRQIQDLRKILWLKAFGHLDLKCNDCNTILVLKVKTLFVTSDWIA